jgi:hypothetical protein
VTRPAHIYLAIDGTAYPLTEPFTFRSSDGTLHALDFSQTSTKLARRKTRDALCGQRVKGEPATVPNGGADDRVAMPWPPPARNPIGPRCPGCFASGKRRPDWTWTAWLPLLTRVSP